MGKISARTRNSQYRVYLCPSIHLVYISILGKGSISFMLSPIGEKENSFKFFTPFVFTAKLYYSVVADSYRVLE